MTVLQVVKDNELVLRSSLLSQAFPWGGFSCLHFEDV